MTLDDLQSKIEKLKKGHKFDLSTDEDLSLAVANLISLEEHFFFTSQKTQKDEYLTLLNEVRELRKKLLAQLIGTHEGETWCASKHLLSATMRTMEVGTKLQTAGKPNEAKEMFATSYKIYNLFWALRLNLLKLPSVPKEMGVNDLVTQLIDCCKE